MKKYAYICLAVMFAIGLSAGPAAHTAFAAQTASDPNANLQTQGVLDWLSSLESASDNKVVIGQYITRQLNNTDGRTPAQAWQYYYHDLNSLTGKYVGLAGFDFSTREKNQQSGSDNTPSDSNWRSYAEEHYNNGGLLRFMWHAGNPWNDASAWSSIPSGHTLDEIITPGNSAYDTWMSWLSALADDLQWYEDHDITIIWGPLHESNGGWFWWGTGSGTSNAAYKAVWQHMYDYFTNTRGLHNLLWAYSPNNNSTAATAVNKYPGNDYVDIVGPDKYDNTYTSIYNEFTQSQYGKVFAWGEVGQNTSSIDNRMYINQIKSTFPKAAYYMQWANNSYPKSIVSNNYADEVMDVDWIITRDEVGLLPVNPAVIVDNSQTGTIAYAGTWSHAADAGYYNGTKSVSNTSGSTASLTFTGTEIHIYTKKTPSSGKYDVYLDGVYDATVDAYDATDQFQVETYGKTGLAPAVHTVSLQLNGQKHPSSGGTYVGFDYFEYAPSYVAVDNSAAGLSYTGAWTHSGDANYYNATKSVSSTSGSAVSYSFTGTEIHLYTKKSSSNGKYDVYIDGVYDATADAYSPSDQFRARTYSKSGLSGGSHTVMLQLNGQKNASSTGYFIGFDYLEFK